MSDFDFPNEKPMTLNGQPLENGDVMTIRVALTNFRQRLQPDGDMHGLGDDDHGVRMTEAYTQRCERLLTVLCDNSTPDEPI